jgi:hypothetical protein
VSGVVGIRDQAHFAGLKAAKVTTVNRTTSTSSAGVKHGSGYEIRTVEERISRLGI